MEVFILLGLPVTSHIQSWLYCLSLVWRHFELVHVEKKQYNIYKKAIIYLIPLLSLLLLLLLSSS